MRAPSRVATISAGALTFAIFAVSVVSAMVKSTHTSDPAMMFAAYAALEALGMATLAWVGVYIGARLLPPHQRSDRLIRVLSLVFVLLGIVLSLPFHTHAVKRDLPLASGMANHIDWGVLILLIVMLALPIVVPLALTRALAAGLGKKVKT